MQSLDHNLLLWINSHHNGFLDAVFVSIARVGDYAMIWFAVCLGLLIFGKRKHRIAAVMLIVTIIVMDKVVSAAIGHLVPRVRPYIAIPGLWHPGTQWATNSFPSGHAHSVWEAAVILGSRWRRLIIPLIVFACLTCYSRPYLGMHYPSDVFAGSILGIAGGFAAVRIERLVANRKRIQCDEG